MTRFSRYSHTDEAGPQATRRAAAAFFFELLVLGTRDCVQISQSAPFENIEVRQKAKLWERQRHGSMAPSISSSMGL
jgi:cohesin complex subunit SCC1